MLLRCIRETIARYNMLAPGDRLGVAVSGGADSTCLLHALLELSGEFDLHLSVIHIDHNLRGPQSQADAEFVRLCAQRLALPFHLKTLDFEPRRGNLEQEARNARYAFFRDLIRDGVVQKIALGHTRSDQAETVLFRLLRGSGSAGFAGVRPVTDAGIVRPLLQVTRAEVENWLVERGIAWREDSTNSDLSFDRNRIRHQLLPLLQAGWNPGLTETLAQTADWAFEEERFWDHENKRLAENWVCFVKGSATLDASRLSALPVAVTRRLIRHIVERVKENLLGVSFQHVEAIRELAASPDGTGRLQIAGVEVWRSFNWLRFVKAGNSCEQPVQNWAFCVTPPGRYALPQAVLELELIRNSGVYNEEVNCLDWERLPGPLTLRNWRPGDRYRRSGHAAPQKIKEIFQEFRVPLWDRREWPVITAGESIVWAKRFGPAAQFAAEAETRTVLRIREMDRETAADA